MINLFKNMPYHLKSAWKSLTRNIAVSISSATAVTVTLILVSMFLMIAGNINEMSNKIESSVQIYVQIDPIVEEDGFASLQSQIEAIKHVEKVKFSSAAEQFDIFLNSDDGGEEYEIFREDNPLPAAFYVDAYAVCGGSPRRTNGFNLLCVADDRGQNCGAGAVPA